MVGAVHYELNTFCDSAKLPDDQLISEKFIVVSHMFFKLFCAVYIIIVGMPALCMMSFIFVYEPESYGLSISDKKSRAFIKNTDFTKRP